MKGNALQEWSIILKVLIEMDALPVFCSKFHGVFNNCFRFDSSRLNCRASAESRSGLDTSCSLKCFKRLHWVTWGSLTSQGNVLLQVSFFDSGQWRRPCRGQPGGWLG